jgi:enolase
MFIAKIIGNEKPSLPRPCFNILEGGKHAGNNLEVQEFMAVPFLDKFSDNLKAGAEVYYHLKLLLIKLINV